MYRISTLGFRIYFSLFICPLLAGKHLSVEYPYLYTNKSIGSICFCKPPVDISPQGVQGYPPFSVPFGPRHLGSAKSAGAIHSDSFGTEFKGRGNTFFHGPPEGNTSLQLKGYILSNELCVYFRLAHLEYVDNNLAL